MQTRNWVRDLDKFHIETHQFERLTKTSIHVKTSTTSSTSHEVNSTASDTQSFGNCTLDSSEQNWINKTFRGRSPLYALLVPPNQGQTNLAKKSDFELLQLDNYNS